MIESAPLFIWLSILATYVRSDRPDLTNVQMAVVLTVYMTPGPHNVANLAAQLHAAKSTISRAVVKLASLGLLKQEADADKRGKLLSPTDDGQAFLADLKRTVERALSSATMKSKLRVLLKDPDLLGDGFRSVYKPADDGQFDDLLSAIDDVA